MQKPVFCLEGIGPVGNAGARVETGRLVGDGDRRPRTGIRFSLLVPAADDFDSNGSEADARDPARGGVMEIGAAGTCSAVHFKRMELEQIGKLAIDIDKLRRSFPDMRPGTIQAVENISIARPSPR
jgi:hypothetical protein